MGERYIPLDEAARQSGLHPNSLRRLLRAGVIDGYKTTWEGRRGWMVSAASLKAYTDPFHGFLLDLPGPKLFLKRRGEEDDED